MQLTAVQGVEDVKDTFRKFEACLSKGAKICEDFTLVYPPPDGPVVRTAYWHPGEGIWAVLEPDEADGRYWCSYGIQDPERARAQKYVCQINVKWRGDGKAVAGAFATDERRRVYLVHSGRLGSGNAFTDSYNGQRASVQWPGAREDERFVIGALDDRHFVANLATYVKAIDRYRAGAQAQPLDKFYRNAIMMGVDTAIDEIRGAGAHEPSTSVARIRLGRLTDLQGWLSDDPELLQTAIDTLTSKAEADRRRRISLSVGGAAASILVGWLLSSVSPASLLRLIGL
jgi:hypothetical protein